MDLLKIINGINPVKITGSIDFDIKDIIYDSRLVIPGSVFVCLEGADLDGHDYIVNALNKGACCIVVSKEISISGVTVITVQDTRNALAIMSANYFENPAHKLVTIGITGTTGKTTTSCMIKSILDTAGKKTGLIGTLGVVIDNKTTPINNTTPESYEVQKYLRCMVDSGCQCAVIEASSIGLRNRRLDGFSFSYGVFTNLSKDHIGGHEHKDMNEYIKCKGLLFKKCKVGFVNIDDQNLTRILQGHTSKIKTFGFSENADIIAQNSKLVIESRYIGCNVEIRGNININVRIPIPGKFNAYNALSAISVCNQMGIDKESIKKGLENVKVKGRLETVKIPGNFNMIIDYAHNALSMKSVLSTLRDYKPKRLITLFGAGGNRPKIRRYEMGKMSGELSDLSVVTSDNSRYEDVMDIINDIKIGLDKTNGKYVIIPDRKKAIEYCMKNAQDGDIVLLAGKGHETYQEIKGVKYYFDERVIISDIIKNVQHYV